jgi:hypothetical protein
VDKVQTARFRGEETLRVADQKQKLSFALCVSHLSTRALGYILTTILLQNVARRLPESQVPKNGRKVHGVGRRWVWRDGAGAGWVLGASALAVGDLEGLGRANAARRAGGDSPDAGQGKPIVVVYLDRRSVGEMSQLIAQLAIRVLRLSNWQKLARRSIGI